MIDNELKRIIILGHTGFIGKHLEDFLKNKYPKIEIVGKSLPLIDLTNDSDMLILKDFFDLNTAVIMCAAKKRENGDNLEMFLDNLKMVTNLCKLMEINPVKRFIFFSSAAVYGEDIENMNINEETKINLKSYYGIAKYSSEHLLRKTINHQDGSSLIILRPPVIYGPGEQIRYGPSGFITAALKKEPILLWGDGTEKREFIYVDDLVRIIGGLIFHSYNGVLNIASGTSYTFVGIIKKISSLTRINIKINSQKRSKNKVDHHFCNDKLRTIFPDFSFTQLEEGLKKTIPYFQTKEVEDKEKKKKQCIICKNNTISTLLDFGMQPICNRFLISPTEEEQKYLLSLAVCNSCGLIQLLNPFPAGELQPKYKWITYQEPERHLDNVRDILLKLPNLEKNAKICGISFKDDTLLERMKKLGFNNVIRLNPKEDLGIENNQEGVETIQKVFTALVAKTITKRYGKFDLVIARHILEHTYNFTEFVESIKELLNPNGYVMLEVPDCTKSLQLLDYSMIWEEHLIYFTPETFKNCFILGGFSLRQLELFPYLSENCLVAIATPKEIIPSAPPSERIQGEISQALNFSSEFAKKKKKLQDFFSDYQKEKGKIAFFGAGHLTSVFINIFDLKNNVSCIIDDNNYKQNLFMPSSKLPIVNSSALLGKDIKLCIFGLNPEIEEKIISKKREFIEKEGEFSSICPASKYSLYNKS